MTQIEQQKIEKVKNYCSIGTIAFVFVLATFTYLWANFFLYSETEVVKSENTRNNTEVTIRQVSNELSVAK